MRLAHRASLAAGGVAGAALARWLGVPPSETLLLAIGAGAMALSVAAGLADDENAADGDGHGGSAQGRASSSRTGMARVTPSRLSQVAKTQGRSLRSIRSPRSFPAHPAGRERRP
jgi:hypothetical protein